MKITDKPDEGLVLALKRRDIPKEGLALEFGCGTGRNLQLMAKFFPNRSVGYDLDPEWTSYVRGAIKYAELRAQVVQGDVLELPIEPESISVAVVGTVIYHPKSIGTKFLRTVWGGLKHKGILHVDFPSVRDHSNGSEFFLYTCKPFPEDGWPNSWGHNCGFDCNLNHAGVLGASFWELDEISRLLESLGKHSVILLKLYEWNQKMSTYDHGSGKQKKEKWPRSFYRATVQKV